MVLGIRTHTDDLLSDGRAAGLDVPVSCVTDGHSYTCFRTERSAGHGRTSVGGLSSLKAPECVMTTTGLRGDAEDGRSPWHLCRRDSISFIQLSFSKLGNGLPTFGDDPHFQSEPHAKSCLSSHVPPTTCATAPTRQPGSRPRMYEESGRYHRMKRGQTLLTLHRDRTRNTAASVCRDDPRGQKSSSKAWSSACRGSRLRPQGLRPAPLKRFQ